MLEFPDGFGLSVQFFGIIALMMMGRFFPIRLQSLAATTLFGLAAFYYAWFAPFGETHSGLFSYNQTSLAFAICFLSFLFFSGALVRGSALRPEAAPMKLCLGFLGLSLLLANNLAVIVLGLPVFTFLSLTGPSVTAHGQRARSGFLAAICSTLLLCLLCLGSGLFISGGGVMGLDSLLASNVSRTEVFEQGWSIVFALLATLVFFYPLGFLLQDASGTDDWGASAVFRIAPSIVFCGLLFKWCRIETTIPSVLALQILAGSFSLLLFLVIVVGRNLLLVLHGVALIPMTALFWSLTNERAIPLAMSALFILSVAISRLIFLADFVGVKPRSDVSGLHSALRAASFGLRLEFFVLGLSIMPLGTFFGFNFHVQLPIEASICAASLTFAMVLLLGRILEVSQPVEVAEVRLNQAESVISVITLAALIVLGIYPTPLYNYINYLSHHP